MGQCEKREMGVGWDATKKGKSEQRVEGGTFWIGREKSECISGWCWESGVGRLICVQEMECF